MSFGYGDFTRGKAYNTTIAYEPGFLSTSMCTGKPQGEYQGFAALNLTELQHPTSYNGTCQGLDVEMEKTTNGPYLSMPPELASLDPAWSTCVVVYWGAFDPPIALHTATALVPGQDSPPTPAPGSPITPPHAPATPTVHPVDPGKPATSSAAPKADPQGPEQQNPHSSDPVKSSADDPKLNPQGPDSQSSKLQHPNSQDPKSQDPSSQDPNSQDPSTHDSSPQDPTPEVPGEHNTNLPHSANSPNGDNDGYPATSAATPPANPLSHNGVNVDQGSSGNSADPQTSNNQSAGEKSGEDAGANPSNEDNAAGSSSTSVGNLNQSPADHSQPLPSIGGHQIQAASEGSIVIASTTIPPGVQTTIDSTPISVDNDQIIIASSTIRLSPQPANPIITLVNGEIISAGGKAAIVSGTTVALAPDDDALIVNGKTSPLPVPPISILTIAGQTLTPAPSGFVIRGQSVLPGGSAVTFSSNTLSLASGGNALIVNGRTTPLFSAPISVFKAGSRSFTAAPTGFAIGGQSVLPGESAVTFAGSTFSLASAGNAIVVNGISTPLPSVPISIFKAGTQAFTATPTGFSIGTQSISPGGSAVMVDGTLVSLGPSQLVIGTSTVPLGSAAQEYGGALTGLIMNGIGGGASPTDKSSNGSNIAPFLGGGGKLRVDIRTVVLTLAVNFGAVMIVLELL